MVLAVKLIGSMLPIDQVYISKYSIYCVYMAVDNLGIKQSEKMMELRFIFSR